MNDTPDFIQRKQFEIMKSKSVEERFNIWAGMMQFARHLAENRIKNRLGEAISEQKMQFEIIKEYHGANLSIAQLTEIEKQLLA